MFFFEVEDVNMCSVYATVMDHDRCTEGIACILVLRIAGVPAPQGLDRWWAASIRAPLYLKNMLAGGRPCRGRSCLLTWRL